MSFMGQLFCYIIDVRGRDNDAQVLILDKEKRGDVSVLLAGIMRCVRVMELIKQISRKSTVERSGWIW